jgi:hypothetical protein
MPLQPWAANGSVAGRRARRRAGDRTVRILTAGVGGLSLMGTGLFSAAAWASTHSQAAHVKRPVSSKRSVPGPAITPATSSTDSSHAGHVKARPTHHASPLQAPASPPAQPTQPPVATSSGS